MREHKEEHEYLGTNKDKLTSIFSMYNNQWLLMLLPESFLGYNSEADVLKKTFNI